MEPDYSDKVNKETQNRIRLSVAACAYEIYNETIMSDHEYDKLSLEVDLTVDTRRPDLDKFFREEFNPSTGVWIHKHPDLKRIKALTVWRIDENR